ncbi:DUF4865 family protein [Methylobacterium oryzisoli]|uniref:DUF4865 family protein n=1 Tax=Methylobacterium oryzisoli TaxID=3385502 RepID=UPI003891CE9E
MLVMHYRHRLPADYDMGRIHERARTRGPSWDATPGLGFKAFAARERGPGGAQDTVYASFYLWLDPQAALAMLTDERFGAVTATFGRPRVDTLLPLDARVRGEAADAAMLRHEDLAVDPATDLAALRRAEAARNEAAMAEPGILARVSALDPAGWRMMRLTLATETAAESPGRVFTVLHLARPGWTALPG